MIGQEYAKKALAVAVHNHYKRLSTLEQPIRCQRATTAAARADG